VPAVAVGTKSGHIFVLNRETGVPLFPVEEHPVPHTTVPGEETSPTQPFPIALPVFGLRQLAAIWLSSQTGRSFAGNKTAWLLR
jgi:quinoprotein glucose dehydrogenase